MSAISDKIRAAQDLAQECLHVPEWDVQVCVKSMNGKSRARLLQQGTRRDGTIDFEVLYPSILIACCFDPESGDPIFSEADAAWLNEKSAGPVERLAQIGMRLSGLDDGALEAGKGSSS